MRRFFAKAKRNQVVRKGKQGGATLENSPNLIDPIDTRETIARKAGEAEQSGIR